MGRPNPIFIEQSNVYLTLTTTTSTLPPVIDQDIFFIPNSGISCVSVISENTFQPIVQTVPNNYRKVADIVVATDNCGPYKFIVTEQFSQYFAVYNNALYIDNVVFSLPSRLYSTTVSIVDIANRFSPISRNFNISITSCPTTTTTTTLAPAVFNSANYNSTANWNGSLGGNVTTVGSNGGPSAYGTYDQAGNVYDWNEAVVGSLRGLRGGYWGDGAVRLSSSFRPSAPLDEENYFGFRLSSSLNPLNLSNFVNVGDSGNNNDSTGYGSVGYNYAIGKYNVTNCEYVEFLNAVASTDTYNLYNTFMNSDARGGITRSGSSGSYTYTVKTNMANKPVVYVSWFDCARYCNWLHNGKGNGDTETGAYTLNGATTGVNITRNVNANYHIPTENEWYKAAYYKGGGTNAGYWLYATQSNTAPTPVTANSTGDGLLNGLPARITDYVCLAPTTTTTSPSTLAGLVGWNYGSGRVASFCNIAGTEDLFNNNFVTLFQNTCIWLTKNTINPRILVLQSGDNNHMARLLTILSQISSNVSSSSRFWGDFNQNVSTSTRDLLIIPCSYNVNYSLQSAPDMLTTYQDQIVNFVNSGGALLTTESFIWLLSQNKMSNLQPIIPALSTNNVLARLFSPTTTLTYSKNASIINNTIFINVDTQFTFNPSYQPADGVFGTRITGNMIKPGATMFYSMIPNGSISINKNFESVQA